MRHTKSVTRKPAHAQSAYASKLLFKQDASTTIALESALLMNNVAVLFTSLIGNALALGTFFTIDIGGGNSTS